MQTVAEIKQRLYQSLANIGDIQECALLDYPDYPNIGDHLIWLGRLFYFSNITKTKIQYPASLQSFNAEIMNKNIIMAQVIVA